LAPSDLQDSAFTFLYNIADATVAFLDLTPTYSFPVLW
jgi:hypothetical protein